MKNLLVALLITGVLGGMSAGQAQANTTVEQEQKLNQELEIECETGSYGQSSTCKARGEQTGEQSQKVVVRDRVLGKTHAPVDTALDAQTMLSVAGVLVTGAGSYALKRKVA